MTDLDVLASEHIDSLDVPAGPGLRALMERGRRRRNRRRAITGLASVAASAVVVVAVALFATRIRETDNDMLVIAGPASGPADTNRSGNTAAGEVFTIDIDRLPARDPELVPTVPTPVINRWTVEAVAVDVSERFSDAGSTIMYRLRTNGSELTMTVATGQTELAVDRVTIDRPTGPIEGSIESAAGGLRRLAWNERPGANNGTAIWLSGPADEQLVEVAATVEFVDLPLTGASDPTFVNLDPDRSTLFSGTTDGSAWSVSYDNGSAETVIKIDGQSPSISGKTVRTSATDVTIETTTVSRDGLQITTIIAPADTTAVEIAFANGGRIPLPLTGIDGNDHQLAVSTIPADREADVIIVTQADGTETNVGLPIAPLNGWTTSRQSLRPG